MDRYTEFTTFLGSDSGPCAKQASAPNVPRSQSNSWASQQYK